MRSWLLICSAIWTLGGCATHATQLIEARQNFYAGDLTAADQTLEKASSRWHRDEDCLLLDRAMVSLVAGNPRVAEQSLRQVRDRFDHLEQSSVTESALATLTDDQRRAYAGEDYEKVLIRTFLALASLMQDGQDAVAYTLQVEQKQQEIISQGLPGGGENPKLAYKQVAFAPYLAGVLRESTHTHYDDAARSFAKVVSWEPGFVGAQQDLQRAQFGRHSQPGCGVVYVFGLVGRGPLKEEAVELPSSDALLIADRILSAVGKYQLPPTIAPIKVPQVVIPPNEVDVVLVDVDGQPAGCTQTVTDIGQLALSQHQAIYSHLVARAVVRRAVKKAVAYGAQDTLSQGNSLLNLGILAAGVAWEFTESADTRCWGLLPDKIQVLRLELPAGPHRLDLRPGCQTRPLAAPRGCEVQVIDGCNTYVLACCPARQLVGKIQVSDPSP